MIIAHSPRTSDNGSGVGTPKAELALTESVLEHAKRLLTPGRGYELFVLTEAEIGIGRPDLLMVVVSPAVVRSRLRLHTRLRNLTEAEILGAHLSSRESSHSKDHVRAVLRRLSESGWDLDHPRRLQRQSTRDSLLIEAKVRDWRGGLVQLSRERTLSHRAALVVPEGVQSRVARPPLKKNTLGLLATSDHEVRIVRKCNPRRVKLAVDLWLTELAARATEYAAS